MKKIISTFLLYLLLFWSIDFSFAADSCKYQSQWDECIEANINGSPRGIDPEDFLCISSLDHEKILYNIVLNDKFKPIDEKATEYLEGLEESKDYYFGSNRKEPYLKGIDTIETIFGENGPLYNDYYYECDGSNSEGILQETLTCLGGSTSVKNSKDFMSSSLCIGLAQAKNDVRKSVAYDILKLNKQSVRKDEMRKYKQKQRSNYELVVDLFMVNLGYLIRISQKWASKTKDPY